ncbi:LamG-like jellyroll fold domain-containing protein [Haloferula sargassicola]|uniref:Ig-like domain-containing protein n=1 Tax=Haloferula sargassicola TaxID=490096 RepID=A0ABP9UNU2_9BACT
MKPLSRSAGGHRRLRAVALLSLGLSGFSHGDITYTLQFDPNSSGEARQVANSVAVAAAFYNQHGSFNKHWNVYSNAGIPTAEANYDGYMGFGGIRNERVVFHEAAHTFGMGTHGNYFGLIAGGVWRGYWGNQAEINTYLANGDGGYDDGLHGDNHAIWPGGFNYDNEDGYLRRLWQTRIMAGLRADLGVLSYTREARNQFATVGDSAEFRVVSPRAHAFQWYRNGVAVTDNARIAGATSSLLRISQAMISDAGTYHCAATGAGETLHCRPRQLWVRPAGEDARYALDGNVSDSAHSFHATAFGSPTYTTGKTGQAIKLDGIDDYLDLPDTAVTARDFTLAAWVYWDGGGDWQRVFDFGNDTYQYLMLTPKSGFNDMRLVFKDAVNGLNAEQVVTTSVLPIGQWVHLAAVKKADALSLYVNGKPVGTLAGVGNSLTDFAPTRNYLGKSQYADPYFDGRIDDFRIFNQALDGSAIWALGSSSANGAPVFSSSEITLPGAVFQTAYANATLASQVTDPEGSMLTFSKLRGPGWISMASDGSISGTPTTAAGYDDALVVRVSDPSGATSEATISIPVTGTVGYWNFEEGTANAEVPYSPATANQYAGSLTDLSGNANHLSPWSGSWHVYRPQVAAATTPQNGLGNALSLQNANDFPAVSAIGTSLTSWEPSAWTIEAAIRPDDATDGYQTFIGRDSQGASGSDYALAALYFAINPEGALRVVFTDKAAHRWELNSAAHTVQDAQWQAVAATCDGSTLSLYLKNVTHGEADYTLVASLDISASTDPALTSGVGDGGDWDAGVFTIARGLYNGGHTDRFYGSIDDIRFTEGALEPSQFLYSTPALTPAESWRELHFSARENAGDAADSADPDHDGIENLLERAFGGDPHHAEAGLLPAPDPAQARLSIVYRRAAGQTDLNIEVQESSDLATGWIPAAGSETVISDDGTTQWIRFTRPAAGDDALFLRVAVTSP